MDPQPHTNPPLPTPPTSLNFIPYGRRALFLPRVPRNLTTRVHFGFHEGPGGSPESWMSWTMNKLVVHHGY